MILLSTILAVFMAVALGFYLYFKMKQIRCTLPIRKKWYQHRAGFTLSAILFLFAVNQIILFPSTLTLIICLLLLILSSWTMLGYIKRIRHYQQFIAEELQLNT